MKLEADRELCHTCNEVTDWEPVRGGKALKCTGCGQRFPCRSTRCGHEDCAEARLKVAA